MRSVQTEIYAVLAETKGLTLEQMAQLFEDPNSTVTQVIQEGATGAVAVAADEKDADARSENKV